MAVSARVCVFMMLAACATWVGCGSSTEPVQTSAWRIDVNPYPPVANRNSQYAMLSTSDTSFVAYKYLWDYDERYSLLKRDLKRNYHVFDDTVGHNISCFAEDSLDHVIGEAHARVQCLPPMGAIAIEKQEDAGDWRTIVFTVNGPTHHYSWTYQWDFGDGTTATGYDTIISHHYASGGSYVARLSVYESSFLFTRDSIQFTVGAPTLTASDFSLMSSVTLYFTDSVGRQSRILSLPLRNDGDYNFTSPPLFTAAYRHAIQHIAGDTVIDSAKVRLIEAALNADGQHFTDVQFFSLDTNHYRDANRETFHSCASSAFPGSFEVLYASADSIGFVSVPINNFGPDCHDSSVTPPGTDPCPAIDPVSITARSAVDTQSPAGTLLLVWRRN